jgi:DeoR family transcriptional regulator, glycerol-3-phosphate regulon repressor
MKPRARQDQIAEMIARDGLVSVDDLTVRFAVSTETIRRDLARLAEEGAVQKVHGGAKRPRLRAEGSLQQRLAENAGAKRIIAEKLAKALEPGETLFIDSGSTTLACAEQLAPKGGFTVITNSLGIAHVFGAALGNAVFLLGGTYHGDNRQTAGPLVIEQIGAFQASRAVLGVAAIDPGAGAMDADFGEAQVARAMISRARGVAVVADASKLGRRAAFQVCATATMDLLITDRPPDAESVRPFHAAGVALL